MKRIIGVETGDTDSSTDTGSLMENNPRRMSGHHIEISTRVSVTFVVDRLEQSLTASCNSQPIFVNCFGNSRMSKRTDVSKRPPHLELLDQHQVAATGLTLNMQNLF